MFASIVTVLQTTDVTLRKVVLSDFSLDVISDAKRQLVQELETLTGVS